MEVYEIKKPYLIFDSQTAIDTATKICRYADNEKKFSKSILYLTNQDENISCQSLLNMKEDDRFDCLRISLEKIYENDSSVIYNKIIELQNEWNKIDDAFLLILEKIFNFQFSGEGFMTAYVSINSILEFSEKDNSIDVCYKKEKENILKDIMTIFISLIWKNFVLLKTENYKEEKDKSVMSILEKFCIYFTLNETKVKTLVKTEEQNIIEKYSIYIDGLNVKQYLLSLFKKGIECFYTEGYNFVYSNINEFIK